MKSVDSAVRTGALNKAVCALFKGLIEWHADPVFEQADYLPTIRINSMWITFKYSYATVP